MQLSNDEKLEILKKILRWSKRHSDGCLICDIGLDSKGYPNVRVRGTLKLVSRIMMHLLTNFNLDSKLLVLHNDSICSNKNCVEFEHLRVGTQSENVRESIDKRSSNNKLGYRKPFCSRGHERTKDNVYSSGNCKICLREQMQKASKRKKRVKSCQM